MSFPREVLVSGIKIADTLTKGVQVAITHEAFIGQSVSGKPSYDAPVTLLAIEDLTSKVEFRGGQLVTIGATLTIVGDVAPNGAVTSPPRREPIDPRDRIVLSDGSTGPILEAPGAVIDPVTNRGLIHIIKLGSRK